MQQILQETKGAKAPSKTNRAAQLLAENVTKLMNSKDYKAALRFRKKLHTYSFRNVWLIYCQRPDASMIAGYARWKELGRHVKKGEKSLAIFAPLIRKEKDTQEPEVFGFRSASVFDLSQTSGDPMPELPKPKILQGDTEQIRKAIKKLELFALQRGNLVSYKPLKANGVYSIKNKTIGIKENLTPLQTLKTLIHELAHAIMHADTTQATHILELEAESCAFLTCDALGLDTREYSFAYLSSWAEKPEEILPAAEKACKATNDIITQLNT